MSYSDHAPARRARTAWIVCTIGALLVLSLPTAAAEIVPDIVPDIVLVTAADGPIDTLGLDIAEQLYLGRRSALADGRPVQLLDLPAGPARDRFYQRLTGKNPAQIRAYWSRLVFTGRALPPREASGIDEARRILLETPGTIGYLPATRASDPALRILLRLD